MAQKKASLLGIALLVLAGMITPLLLAAPSGAQAPASTWRYTGGPNGQRSDMATPRERHTASLLTGGRCETGEGPRPDWCGKVLVVGGWTKTNAGPNAPRSQELRSAELYDPRTGTWQPTTSLSQGRFLHSAVVLTGERCRLSGLCGHVLVVGGETKEWNGPDGIVLTTSAELYDPETGWQNQDIPQDVSPEYVAGDSELNSEHTATVLGDGTVLYVGRGVGNPSWPGLLYDPGAPPGRRWSGTSTTTVVARARGHFAVLINGPNCGQNCGRVLIGGSGPSALGDTTAELYDPLTKSFIPTATMALPGNQADAVQLSDGTVLVVGPAGSQIYDPAPGSWRETGELNNPARSTRDAGRFLSAIPNGGAIVAGGTNLSPSELNAVPESKRISEIFFPDEIAPNGARGAWKTATLLNEVRRSSQLVALGCEAPSSGFITVGGYRLTAPPDLTSSLASAEIFGRMPTIDSVEPRRAPLSGGVPVKIRGTGLQPLIPGGAVQVKIGEVAAPNVSVNAEGTEITATTPAAPASGAKKISVTVGGLPAHCSDPSIEYLPVPELTGINPPTGPATGETTVRLTGTGLAPESSVRFGDEAARNVRVAPDGRSITVEAPPHNPGEVPVVVSSPAGEVQTVYKYIPAITGVVPDRGPTEGGTTVTIAGKGFTGARTVTFDGIATAPERVTDGAITVKSPPHPLGQVALGVDVPPHGQAIPVSAGVNNFTYGASPLAPPAGGDAESLAGASSSLSPTSQGPTTTGGGPAASGGSPPPPPAQTQPVPILSQSPVSAFEPGSAAMPGPAAMESGSAVPLGTPAGVQVPGAAGSQASAPMPALVSVPDFVPDRAEQYAMVGYSASGSGPGVLPLGAGLVALALCGGMFLGRRSDETSPRARPQEAY